MRKIIISLRGKLFQITEIHPEEVAAIARANGYENSERFIDRHANWQSTIEDDLRIFNSLPVRPPRHKAKPAMQIIGEEGAGAAPRRGGRPPGGKAERKNSEHLIGKKQRRKKRCKYGFNKIKVKGDSIFVEADAALVAASAAYFGNRCIPRRKFSVHKVKLGDKIGSRVEWVQ